LNIKPVDYLKVISVNIERDLHLDRLIPFLKEHQPDIVLMQEVFEKDIAFLEKATGMHSSFAVLNSFKNMENSNLGLLSLSVLPTKTYSIYYRGNSSEPPIIEIGKNQGALIARAILVTEFTKDNHRYCVINTHFTWTPDGRASEKQYVDLDKMMNHLEEIPEFIMGGDFNAPRGRVIFDKIAKKYKDNIPKNITTTIDKDLHKAGDLQLVVDSIFTTPIYHVDSLEVISGVSDHCAIVATISVK
jgi:endonuclease/exonuclease/phosphatase family metal-dependent hydrolase